MLTSTKSSTRIDLDQQFVLICLRNLLPGWLDQDIIYGKWLKILFPVVDPVLVLCLRSGDRALTHIHKIA